LNGFSTGSGRHRSAGHWGRRLAMPAQLGLRKEVSDRDNLLAY
jgi:hypothetical protein